MGYKKYFKVPTRRSTVVKLHCYVWLLVWKYNLAYKKNIKIIATEVFESFHDLNPTFMKEMFNTNTYHMILEINISCIFQDLIT